MNVNSRIKISIFSFLFIVLSVQLIFSAPSRRRRPSEVDEDVILKMNTGYEKCYAVGKIPFKSMVDLTEIGNDLHALCYIIENQYAGYENMLDLGYDSVDFEVEVSKQFYGENEVYTRDFVKAVNQALKPYIQDSTFSIYTPDYSSSCVDKKVIHFSDVYVEKRKNGYFIWESGRSGIAKGLSFDDDEDFLFYYPVKGENIFRIGILTENDPSSVKVRINGKNTVLSVKKEGSVLVNRNMIYREKETDSSAYLSMTSWNIPAMTSTWYEGTKRTLEKFMDAAIRFKDKKNIILDIRGNLGGYSYAQEQFFTNLFYGITQEDNEKEFKKLENDIEASKIELYKGAIDLIGPVIVQTWKANSEYIDPLTGFNMDEDQIWTSYAKMRGDPSKIWYPHYRTKNEIAQSIAGSDQKIKKSAFKGKVFILVDRNTAAASELTILFAKYFFGKNHQVVIIGENTNGSGEFASPVECCLPASGVSTSMGYVSYKDMFDNYPSWQGEGVGFYPDYWCMGEDLLDTLIFACGDEELRIPLKNLYYSLQ